MLHDNRQEFTRARQQQLTELRRRLRFAVSEQERKTLAAQIDFWQRQA